MHSNAMVKKSYLEFIIYFLLELLFIICVMTTPYTLKVHVLASTLCMTIQFDDSNFLPTAVTWSTYLIQPDRSWLKNEV